MEKSFKQTCVELRKKDYTLNEIVKITGRSKTTVYFHIRDIELSPEKKQKISQSSRLRALQNSQRRKGKSLRAFSKFSEWSPETVLLLAHLIFDGELSKGRCRYHNRSQTLVERVERLMKLIYKFPPRKSIDSNTGVTTLGFYNVALQAYLHQKSQILLKNIQRAPIEHKRAFLRAFFDDEGCMYIKNNNRRVRGYQKEKRILSIVSSLLSDFGIESDIKMPNEVVIFKKENLIKFRDEINFSKGVRINPNRTNSLWKKNLEKRQLLDMAIASFKK